MPASTISVRTLRIYGFIAASDLDRSCKDEVVSQLVELRRRATEYARRDGSIAEEDFFDAEQNARVVKNAEEYYRSMFFGEVSSWNLRDRHMVETLEAHLGRQGRRAKVIVWAHNSPVPAPARRWWRRPNALKRLAPWSRAAAVPIWPDRPSRGVRAPTLLIVGGNDVQVLALNRTPLAQLPRAHRHDQRFPARPCSYSA